MGYIVGIDTGGTFTDGVVVDTTSPLVVKAKVRTTSFDLTECFVEILREAAEKLGLSFQDFLRNCESIRYSHTIATNTIITRTGTRLGIMCTQG
ncbi:MAG: hydantoinase/oxoprolinase N-terminal domain-containing protein, partial [Rhabdochlamydiaceae bacterium]